MPGRVGPAFGKTADFKKAINKIIGGTPTRRKKKPGKAPDAPTVSGRLGQILRDRPKLPKQ